MSDREARYFKEWHLTAAVEPRKLGAFIGDALIGLTSERLELVPLKIGSFLVRDNPRDLGFVTKSYADGSRTSTMLTRATSGWVRVSPGSLAVSYECPRHSETSRAYVTASKHHEIYEVPSRQVQRKFSVEWDGRLHLNGVVKGLQDAELETALAEGGDYEVNLKIDQAVANHRNSLAANIPVAFQFARLEVAAPTDGPLAPRLVGAWRPVAGDF